MELIEVKKFNLGAKGETLYNLWKCDVNFRDPQIQIHYNWRRGSVAEHKQYKAGALKRKWQVKQSGNILK
jgi:hypothetical protein